MPTTNGDTFNGLTITSVWAAGIPSKSYFPGHAVNQADQDTRAEIDRLFPDLHSKAQEEWLTARPVARHFKAALLN